MQFDQLCRKAGLDTEQDIQLIKRHLIATKRLYQKMNQDIWACKFGNEIIDTDFGILKIKKTMQVLQGIISDLETEIQKSKSEARMLVSLGLNTRALYNLKVAKKLDLVLQQRLSSLDTLDNLLSKINQSKTQLDILSAYEVGTAKLKEILNKDELKLDNVQDTMDALTDVLEDQEEISNAMASVEDFDEELESELNALIQSEPLSAVDTPERTPFFEPAPIISQPGTPLRARTPLGKSEPKISTPVMKMKVMATSPTKVNLPRANSSSLHGSSRSSNKDAELESRLEQLKVLGTPPSPVKPKNNVNEMMPAE